MTHKKSHDLRVLSAAHNVDIEDTSLKQVARWRYTLVHKSLITKSIS